MTSIVIVLGAVEPFFAYDPAISPDGEQVCFVYQNDLWSVPFKGGDAKRLTSTDASEWGPMWSPNGQFIAFNSNREGQNYVYIIPSQGGEAKVVFRESFNLCDWFTDGANLLVTQSTFQYGSTLYKLPLNGSRPQIIAEIGDGYCSLSPNNDKILFNRKGYPYREAYTGSANGELWEINLKSKSYTNLTNTPYTERYPRYSHASKSIFYAGSDGNVFQLYRVENYDFSKPFKLTSFTQWSARDISIARTNDRIVFERFDEIWKYDPTKIGLDRASKLAINIPEDLWKDPIKKDIMKDDFSTFSISNNELINVFQYKYDLFAMPRKGGEVKQLTFDHAGVNDIAFLPDNKTAIVSRMSAGRNSLFKVVIDSTITLSPIEWFGKDKYHINSINKSEANKWVIFFTNDTMGGKLAIADSSFSNIYPIDIPSAISNFSISPDGDYAIYTTVREDILIREIYLYDFRKDTHIKLCNDEAWISSIIWTPDQKSVLFSRSGDIYRMDFVARDEFEFDKDNWTEILTNSPRISVSDSTSIQGKTDKAPLSVDDASVNGFVYNLQDMAKRIYPVVMDIDGYSYAFKAIDDSTFYYIQGGYSFNGEAKLIKTNIYGNNSKDELKLGKNTGQYQLIDKTLYYLENGVLKTARIGGSSKKEISATFPYSYDLNVLNQRVFEEAWGMFGLNFYDPNMHGKNWKDLYNLYKPYLTEATSIRDVSVIIDEMIGEVNASHTGFYPREDNSYSYKSKAYLGIEFDYSKPTAKGLQVSQVFTRSRLNTFYQIQKDDILTHIDGIQITPFTPVDSLLADKIDKKINLQFKRKDAVIKAQVTGISRSSQRSLWYQDKVEANRLLVNDLSDGRLGYVHIPAMGSSDYTVFIRDVFRDNADKEALVIDVRGNSGGRIHDQLITFLTKKQYAYSTSRYYGANKRPQPSRSWNKASIVLVDENSFSDGEIFPILYQDLKLGKVVGMPSSGSVIGTWQHELLDGSEMRLPGSGWYKIDGTNMEGSGAKPDILVELTPNDVIAGNDPQLRTAIDELLREIDQ
jgi:C-terminal processing protease CtpA/Prc/tricorn protease-like protein